MNINNGSKIIKIAKLIITLKFKNFNFLFFNIINIILS